MIAMAGRRIQLTTIVLWILGTFLVLLWAAPLFWMFSTSLKPEGQIMTPTVEWLPRQVVFTNYIAVFQEPVARWFLNSVVVSVVDTLGALVVGAMAGYALARLHFPGRGLIFFLILAALMIPGEMTIVPLYVGALKLGLASTYMALILPAVADVFTVYLFRQFFLNLPLELEDAAAIDGCNRFQTFFHIALPLAQPAAIAGAILVFSGNWNAFLWPLLIMMDESMFTLPVGMARFNPGLMQLGHNTYNFGMAMAAMTILALPSLLVFLALQRYFMQGVTTIGIKG